ncbi:MAG: sugar ABC transporter substrate-binding protein [Chloroflexi bacterium]|nr:sugar ABC transporter substrate-binding protein [Chloroflexota bacterium]
MTPQPHPRAVSRRSLLQIGIGSVALPLLAACGVAATPTAAPAKPAAEPTKPAVAPAATPTTAAAAAKPAAEPTKPAAAPAATSAPAPAAGATTYSPSTQKAIDEAKKFKGETVTVAWESGLQAQDPLLFSGPKFEELTGVKVKVVEMTGGNESFSKLMAEHLAGSSAIDCAGIQPAWLPDMVSANALLPIDDYIKRWLDPKVLDDYLPIYKAIATWDGKIYGFFDDGDALVWYYRKDLFEDPKTQADFKSKYGRDLGTPKTYDFQQYVDAATFLTEQGKGKFHGVGLLNAGASWAWFQAWFRMNGGQFFDPETMKPGINSPAAIKTMENILLARKAMPPGAEQLDAVSLFTAYLSGQLAMTSFWAPLGRWAEGYGGRPKQLSFVPETQVAGKTGYAPLPGGYTEMAGGFYLSVLSNSKKKDLAYAYIQWMTSPEVSLERVMLPYALRDPYRISHIESPLFRKAWANASDYLDTLKLLGSGKAFLDMIMPGYSEYSQAYAEAQTAILSGKDIKGSLDETAAKWEKTTDRLGRDKQQKAYRNYLAMPGSTLQSLTR